MKKIQIYRASLRRSGVLRVADTQASCLRQAAHILQTFLADAPTERIAVLYLDGQNNVLGVECVAMGGLGTCAVAWCHHCDGASHHRRAQSPERRPDTELRRSGNDTGPSARWECHRHYGPRPHRGHAERTLRVNS